MSLKITIMILSMATIRFGAVVPLSHQAWAQKPSSGTVTVPLPEPKRECWDKKTKKWIKC
jgi:hypothetical protein